MGGVLAAWPVPNTATGLLSQLGWLMVGLIHGGEQQKHKKARAHGVFGSVWPVFDVSHPCLARILGRLTC